MAATSSPNLVSLIQNPEEKKAGRRSSDPHPPRHFKSSPQSHPQLCSRPSPVASPSSLPPSPADHTDLLLQPPSLLHPSVSPSKSLRHSLRTCQPLPGKQATIFRSSCSLLSSNPAPSPQSNSQLRSRLSSFFTLNHSGLNRSWHTLLSLLGTPLGRPLPAHHLYS